MADYLTDDEVFGASYLSDDEVFGAPVAADIATDEPQEVVTSARAWRGAGAGRGGANDPRRLDTASGRRNVAVETELGRLAEINPVDRESLRPMAEFSVDNKPATAPAVDREAQYIEKGYDEKGAKLNAAFDAQIESRLNKPFQEAEADPNTGERIGRAYNPNTEADRVAAEIKESDLVRRDARQRAMAEDMPAPVRGLAKGALQAAGLAQGTAGFIGDVLDSKELKEWGLEGYRDIMRQSGNLNVAKNFTQIQSPGEAAGWLAENSGYVAFQAAQSLLAAGLGGAVASTVGKQALGEAVGLAVSNLSQTFGSVYGEAADQARKTGQEVDLRKVAIGATLSAAVDTIADKMGLDSISAQGFKGNALARVAKSGGLQMGVQGGTEAAQLVPEEWGAGRDPFRKGMGAQYLDEAAVGALGGIGPGAAGAINRVDQPAPTNSAGQTVEEILRTEIGTSDLISPAATVNAAAAAERARLEQMRSTASQAKIAVARVKEDAVAEIGQAATVDEAIQAATRAVSIDDKALLNATLQSAGVDPAELAAADRPAVLPVAQVEQNAPAAQAVDNIQQLLAPSAQQATSQQPTAETRTPIKTWSGRRGDGYATPSDAERGLNERQRLSPDLTWAVEQTPDGRFRLAGYEKEQVAPVQNVEAEIQQAEQQLAAAEQPMQMVRRGTGTLAVTGGDVVAMQSRLQAAGITDSIPITNGFLVSKRNAAQAEALLRTPAPVEAPNVQVAPQPAATTSQAQQIQASEPARVDTAEPAGIPAAGAGTVEAAGVEIPTSPTETQVLPQEGENPAVREMGSLLVGADPAQLLYLARNQTTPLGEAAAAELRRRETDAAYRQRDDVKAAEEAAIVEEARDQQAAQAVAQSEAQELEAPTAMAQALERAREKTRARGEEPQFSRSPEPMSMELAQALMAIKPRARATKESVKAAIKELVNGFGILPQGLGKIVVANASEIRNDWEPLIGPVAMESEDAGRAQGFYDPKTNTIFLIPEHIRAGDEIGVVAHELMHKHGEAVLGEENWMKLHSAIGGWANAKEGSQERQVYDEAAARVESSGPELSTQELFPYAVQVALEMGVKPNLIAPKGTVARWLGQVRLALRQVWDKITRKPELFNAQDLVNLAFGIAQRENPAHTNELDNATQAVSALEELSSDEGLFALPKSDKDTIEGIAADHDPGIKVRTTKFPGNETMHTLTMPDGTTATITVRASGPGSVYGANDLGQGEYEWLQGRPGENPEDVSPDKEDVWLDVSRLKPGKYGGMAYNIAATLAHNTGRIFIGDPSGLSDVAMRRRAEQMLSSALKFGTTEHLAPHPRQVDGDASIGVPPLRWVYGDHEGNIARLIDVNVRSLDNAFPNSQNLSYDLDAGTFRNTATGRAIGRDGLARLVAGGINRIPRGPGGALGGAAGASSAGWRTVARGAVFNALLARWGRPSERDGKSGGTERGQAGSTALDQAVLQPDQSGSRADRSIESPGGILADLADQREVLGAPLEEDRIFYSRGADESAADVEAPESTLTPVPEETRLRAIQRTVQDKLNRFTVLGKWAEENGIDLTAEADVWGYEARMHGRVASQVEDFREQTVEPLIKKIQEAGFTMEQVAEFLHAQHAEERNAQIESIDPAIKDGSGMTNEEAAEILKKAPDGLSELANELRAITDSTREMLLTSGIITPEMSEAWTAAYQNYVPLKGGDEKGQMGAGKGLSVDGRQKRALGHGARDEKVVENILRDHERAIMLAEKNRVGQSLLVFVDQLGNPDIATIGQPERRRVLKQGTMYEARTPDGIVVDSFTTTQQALRFVQAHPEMKLEVKPVKADPMVVSMASPMLAENEAQVYVAGHAVRVQLNDEPLARAYKNMGIEGLTTLMKINREINATLSKVYTALNPEFLLKNIARDFTAGLTITTAKYGAGVAARAVKNYPIAMGKLIRYGLTKKADPAIVRYRMSGGSTGAAYIGDLERIGQDVLASYDEFRGVIATLKEDGSKRAARAAGRKALRYGLKWLEILNGAGESAMRLAVFEAMQQTGNDTRASASAAKELLNFNRKGEMTRSVGGWYLFLNANIQGTAALADAMVNGKHREQGWAMVAAMASLFYTLASMQFGGDDEDQKTWNRISDDVKSKNMIIRTGPDKYLTIPVPYGFGAFYALGNAVFDLQHGKDPQKVALNLATTFMDHFSPVKPFTEDGDSRGLIELMPGVAGGELMRAALRAGVNRSGLGGDIVPDSKFDEGKPDHLRAYRNTRSSVFQSIATKLNEISGGTMTQSGMVDVSPETLKYWTRTLTGGAGVFVADVFGWGRLKAEALLNPEDPYVDALKADLAEMPIVRGFVREDRIGDDRRAYWADARRVRKADQDLDRAAKLGDEEGAQRIEDERGELLGLVKMMERSNKHIKNIRDEVEEIMADETTSMGFKRLKAKELEMEERVIYREFIDAVAADTKEMKELRATEARLAKAKGR